jgi:hypothetical protein
MAEISGIRLACLALCLSFLQALDGQKATIRHCLAVRESDRRLFWLCKMDSQWVQKENKSSRL